MTDREAFEKWAESNGFDTYKTDEGIYRVKSTDAMYGGWVAGMNRAVEVHSRLCAEWARICEYQKRHGAKVGAQECANIIRGHLPINHPAKQEVQP